MELLHFGIVLIALYIVAGGIYRLYFCPIAKFPGPKLNALTFWVQIYHDVIRKGKYFAQVEKLHEEYGPIVRINPQELHIKDNDFHHLLYVGANVRKTDKWYVATRGFPTTGAGFSTNSHELHRLRRGAINPYFSRQAVTRLEPLIWRNVDLLFTRLRQLRGSRSPVNLVYAYSAIAADVVSEYSFARSWGCLEDPEFAPDVHEIQMTNNKLMHTLQFFPWLTTLIMALPKRVALYLNPKMLRSMNNQERIDAQIADIVSGNNDYDKTAPHRTIFHEILQSSLAPSEKTVKRLGHEAQTVTGAAIVTTSGVLAITSFYLLSNPDKLEKLRESLKELMADYPQSHPTWAQLEQVPYLTAVVNEGLRMAYGASTRLARVAPDTAIQYKDWTIPAGTPVSMSPTDMMDDSTTYPSPRTFHPERWIETKGLPVHKNFAPFGRGTRNCVGVNLAQAELHITLAALFNPNAPQMNLFETSVADVEMVHDQMAPAPREGSMGVRVLVT